MWLLPLFSPISRLALRTFYRLRVSGRVPESGPVLLVANHPNSLLDPAAVVAVAGRPVRFLAKAPLFSDPQIGWLVRAAGAIPIYRRSDDPTLMERNEDTFRAVYEALHRGAAVGIFPEGISHNEPALAPLKTGAARIALGGGDGVPFPVIPIGLSLAAKEQFRSEALIVVGDPIEWVDLAPRGVEDAEAVRELTRRIDDGLREVTINLERWEDAPLVEYAEEIYVAEQGIETEPQRHLRGLREVTEGLARIRAGGREEWTPLARDIRRHARILQTLGLRPHQLSQPGHGDTLRWTLRNSILLVLTTPVALLGILVFIIPYQLTGRLERRASPGRDVRATYKLLLGIILYSLWIVFLSVLAGWRLGVGAGFLALVALVVLGPATLWVMERRRATQAEMRRFVIRRRHETLIDLLRQKQSELADRLTNLRKAFETA